MNAFTKETYRSGGYCERQYRIYILRHPITNEIFYVGQTKKPLSDRLHGHIKAAQGKFEKFTNEQKDAYILLLLKSGLRPKIESIEVITPTSQIDFLEIVEKEIAWMKNIQAKGHPLTNIIGLRIPQLNSKYLFYLEQRQKGLVDLKYYFSGYDVKGNALYHKERIIADGGCWIEDKISVTYNPFKNERFLKKMGLT